MEFLLASQRKYRTRILLKQLLLLLLRILGIVGLVLLFAQPRWDRNLGSVLGSNRTRHVALLDDSYSMGEVFEIGDSSDLPTTTAMTRGRKMVERLLEELAATPGQQDFSLGRLSKLQRTSSAHSNKTSETATGNNFLTSMPKLLHRKTSIHCVTRYKRFVLLLPQQKSLLEFEIFCHSLREMTGLVSSGS